MIYIGVPPLVIDLAAFKKINETKFGLLLNFDFYPNLCSKRQGFEIFNLCEVPREIILYFTEEMFSFEI